MFIVSFIDQIIKEKILLLFISNKITDYKINHFLTITEVWNSGVIFSTLDKYTLPPLVFINTSLILMVTIMYLFFNTDAILGGIFLGGLISNLKDRVIFGKVLDFIALYFMNFHCPIFNTSDVFIIVGLTLILNKSRVLFIKHSTK